MGPCEGRTTGVIQLAVGRTMKAKAARQPAMLRCAVTRRWCRPREEARLRLRPDDDAPPSGIRRRGGERKARASRVVTVRVPAAEMRESADCVWQRLQRRQAPQARSRQPQQRYSAAVHASCQRAGAGFMGSWPAQHHPHWRPHNWPQQPGSTGHQQCCIY